MPRRKYLGCRAQPRQLNHAQPERVVLALEGLRALIGCFRAFAERLHPTAKDMVFMAQSLIFKCYSGSVFCSTLHCLGSVCCYLRSSFASNSVPLGFRFLLVVFLQLIDIAGRIYRLVQLSIMLSLRMSALAHMSAHHDLII